MFALPVIAGMGKFLGLGPRVWVAIGAVLLVLLIAVAGYGWGYGSGATKATEKAAKVMEDHLAKDRAREKEQARLLAEANDRNRKQEKAHEREVADLRAEFAQQQADAEARDARTIADLKSGNERMRLKVSSCSPPGPRKAGAPSGRVDATGSAELAPETATALWGIASDGDRAIRKLNALQVWAKSAVTLCGEQQHE